jgi:hypothetical protein
MWFLVGIFKQQNRKLFGFGEAVGMNAIQSKMQKNFRLRFFKTNGKKKGVNLSTPIGRIG